MAREIPTRNIAPVLAAAEEWLKRCVVSDGSMFSQASLWIPSVVQEVYEAFVKHPDYGEDDFMTKLKGQLKDAPPAGRQLMAEMLWALLLFPSNMKARTKRQQIREIWGVSGRYLDAGHPLLSDAVLEGIGSGGPGFNNYRPDEMAFLIEVTRSLKQKDPAERQRVLTNYEPFIEWIDAVPQEGRRQFRHMLRFFAFPDRVERMSSNNDRQRTLEAFGVAPLRETKGWTDQQLDAALFDLRQRLQKSNPSAVLDFYAPPLREQWSRERKVKTAEGVVTVTVPTDEEEQEDGDQGTRTTEARQSLQVQAKLAEIGAIMDFKVWIPRGDRSRILELVPQREHAAFLEDLPLNSDSTTLATIEQIDVIWVKGRSIVRAFEVEHSTAVYSGLLRMADLLALQPNMDIRLCIVAPDERREKVFREMSRPVFVYLERGPLTHSCTFISYESVYAIRSLEHLSHTNESVLAEYEERVELHES